MARGDLVQAGVLTNPQLILLFPGGDKQLEYMLFLPLEAIFFREHRITIAERDYCRISQELVQNGLNLVRDVRVAYSDFVFAEERAALAEEALRVRSRIAKLSDARFAAGDISELEVTTARIDALTAQAEAAGLREQVGVARERLTQLMGIGLLDLTLESSDRVRQPQLDLDEKVLLADAMVSRPDLRAARYAVAAVDQQAQLSRWTWLRFDAGVDRNSGGNGPTNIGPALRLDVPIFDRNQGGIIRSDWTVDQALHNFDAVRDQVIMEVRTAMAQLRQAEVSLTILQEDVLPSLEDAVDVAEQAYRNGGTTYFLALQTTSQFLDARARELELLAAEQRAVAELERGIGRRLSVPPTSTLEESKTPVRAGDVIVSPELQNKASAGLAVGRDGVHNGSDLPRRTVQMPSAADEFPADDDETRQLQSTDDEILPAISASTEFDWTTERRWSTFDWSDHPASSAHHDVRVSAAF
jgi:cobalt-zinc-cadmium efflux system outer membrane protein